MKLLFLFVLTLTLVSCASNREPSSVQEDVSEGINGDYNYGSR